MKTELKNRWGNPYDDFYEVGDYVAAINDRYHSETHADYDLYEVNRITNAFGKITYSLRKIGFVVRQWDGHTEFHDWNFSPHQYKELEEFAKHIGDLIMAQHNDDDWKPDCGALSPDDEQWIFPKDKYELKPLKADIII